ncbi:hypothetical protein NDU88_000655 [Pleurodeles waltl]|uniref:Uncharacterized protein n=1 Tax=Pleurodeles waltl TaxID=8319 RepID=A0AAV7SA92_PLEWA|nr:hypothetical protein NDU88_000655 [Pleurodeles waltl]
MRHTSSFFTAVSQISAFFCLRLRRLFIGLARYSVNCILRVLRLFVATSVATSVLCPERTFFPLKSFIFVLIRVPKLQPIDSTRIPSAVKSRKCDAFRDIYTNMKECTSLDTRVDGNFNFYDDLKYLMVQKNGDKMRGRRKMEMYQ